MRTQLCLRTHASARRGPPAVRTQLCLAIIALTVHVPAHKWEGGEPVLWIAGRLRSQPAEVALPCMLELLGLMPQVG